MPKPPKTVWGRLTAGAAAAALVFSGFTAGAASAQPPVTSPEVTASLVRQGADLSVATKKLASTKLTVTSKTKKNVNVGTKLTFKGKTSKNLKGKYVKLQIKQGKKWKTLKSSKVKSNKTFAVSAKATKAGYQKYRLVVPKTKTTKAAISPTYKYTIWKWYNVVNLPEISGNWDVYIESAKIGGRNYAKSLVTDGDSDDTWAEFNVNYKCTKFRSTIGMSDETKTGGSRSFRLGMDDTAKSFGTMNIGRGKYVTADITNVYRISLEFGEASRWDTYGVFGNPQVYCKAKP